MVFDISGKVAIVTGGASGLGLDYAKELLRNGLRAVTLADINENSGRQAIQEVEREFGPHKAIYVPVDVTNYNKFENVFKETIKHFKNVDILVNNAGIINEPAWDRVVSVNVVGVMNGTVLGLENYIPKYKSGDEGVIVNVASVLSLEAAPMIPIYCATKHAVLGLSVSFGAKVHYDRTRVRLVTLCPGVTETPILHDSIQNTLSEDYKKLQGEMREEYPIQQRSAVSKGLVNTLKEAETGTVWVVESGENPYQYFMPGRKAFAPK